ncbi:MAG: hypothetical protein K6C96_00335 [Butyrivibrio sp.]|nr:hypothetical protein [Butyrivibrio sp.]
MAIVSAHYKDDLTIYYNGRGDTNYAISKVPPKGVGSYTASLTIGGETAAVNYEIQKKDLTVTADDKKIFYGENAPSNYTYSCDGFVNGDNKSSLGGDISFECKYRNGDDAGEYAIVPKGLT